MDGEKEYLTVAEAASVLGLGESTVWLLLKRSDLTRYRIPGEGKKTYLKRSDLMRLKEPIPVEPQKGKVAA